MRIKELLKDIARDVSVRFFFLENGVPTNIKDLKDMEVALDVAAVKADPAQMGWNRRPRIWFEFCLVPMSAQVLGQGASKRLAILAAARRLGPMEPIFRCRFFPRYLRVRNQTVSRGQVPVLDLPLAARDDPMGPRPGRTQRS